ncbi:cytochrome b561 domain-containing protein [Algirhabdus cladophorae]|uniref:cytochrome b561 domain-containing protein n=1 Tax=Algirhabdus cladophorae TaxID=3377108 RepID=UPI003B848C79
MEWLLAPIDASRVHDVGWHLSWHARLMVAAWGFLVPVGILAARYFKVLPRQNWPHDCDSQVWWVIHRVMQYSAVVLMLIALWLIRTAPPFTITAGPHVYFGWIILALTVVQVAGGILRGSKGGPTDLDLRGDHFDMTGRRVVFERVHKIAGYVALGLSAAAILSGMWQANAPIWMWIVLPLWWCVLGVCFAVLQRRGMAIDTYQAIWGPNPNLPGNQRKPIGFGVRQSRSEAGE